MRYIAHGNEIFYVDADDREHLFLTVHPTPSDMPIEEQAKVLADWLCQLPLRSAGTN